MADELFSYRQPSKDFMDDSLESSQTKEILVARERALAGYGMSGCITVMLGRVPRKCNQCMLIDEVEAAGFMGLYDFLYLAMDRRGILNRRIAFINFIAAEYAERFYQTFHSKTLQHFHSTQQPLIVMPADLQGFEANAARWVKCREASKHCVNKPLFLRPIPQEVEENALKQSLQATSKHSIHDASNEEATWGNSKQVTSSLEASWGMSQPNPSIWEAPWVQPSPDLDPPSHGALWGKQVNNFKGPCDLRPPSFESAGTEATVRRPNPDFDPCFLQQAYRWSKPPQSLEAIWKNEATNSQPPFNKVDLESKSMPPQYCHEAPASSTVFIRISM